MGKFKEGIMPVIVPKKVPRRFPRRHHQQRPMRHGTMRAVVQAEALADRSREKGGILRCSGEL